MKRKRTIGVLMDWYRPGVIDGLKAYCSEHEGWQLDVRWAPRADWVDRAILGQWDAVVSHILTSKGTVELIESLGMPHVSLNRSTKAALNVFSDFSACAELMVQEFKSVGCEVFLAPVVEGGNIQAEVLVTELVREAAGLGGMEVVERRFDAGVPFTERLEQLVAFTGELKGKRVGFGTPHTGIAYGFIYSLLGAGIRLPEDIAVISLAKDIQRPEEMARVPVTTVELDHWSSGYRAAELLARAGCERETIYVRPIGIQRRESTGGGGAHDHRVARALELIELLAHEPIGVEAISSRCGIGRRTLEQRFHKVTGKTLMGAINAKRMDLAEGYLRGGNDTIEVIAEKVGYSSGHYLSRVFKREMGMTPGAYRRMFR
ncbi:helix-turn-helix domain-containing protein [Rubritalea tangerina]|uniref:Helix-turn-helix domain-containing protein n=1 Tax=Rubritalea tangerina TaxID=430798 RepID=A0ABW4Z6W1_9BACT